MALSQSWVNCVIPERYPNDLFFKFSSAEVPKFLLFCVAKISGCIWKRLFMKGFNWLNFEMWNPCLVSCLMSQEENGEGV